MDQMKQMIREFENILNMHTDNPMKGVNAAINFIVRKYSKSETDTICPYLSKRLGIAEWIIRCDITKRYRQMK